MSVIIRINLMDIMNSFALSRHFWNYAFENTGKIKPIHVSIYFFAMEHCNRLGWKKNFGLPTSMVLEAISVKSYSVYKSAFDDLVEFGLIDVIQYSKNQYSSNIIALKENKKATTKALDKAFINHAAKQTETTRQSTGQSKDSIDKPYNQLTNNQEQITSAPADADINIWPSFDDFWKKYDKKVGKPKSEKLWKKISQAGREKIMQHLEQYVPEVDKHFRKDPERYLKHECWNDEIIKQNHGKGTTEVKSTGNIGSLMEGFKRRNAATIEGG